MDQEVTSGLTVGIKELPTDRQTDRPKVCTCCLWERKRDRITPEYTCRAAGVGVPVSSGVFVAVFLSAELDFNLTLLIV